MFRRLASSLPPDFERAADLQSMGYYLDDSTDQIRSIKSPHHDFNSFISKNERLNEVHTEAYHECIRRIVQSRLLALGLRIQHIRASPDNNQDASSRKGQIQPINGNGSYCSLQESPSIPILATPNLSSAPRSIFYFGEKMQDLAIFAYRVIGQEAVDKGSIVDFAKAILQSHPEEANQDYNDPPRYRSEVGLMIANCGQLLWHHASGGKAMTETSWRAQQRESAVHDSTPVHEKWNRVPGNEVIDAHVKSVFDFYIEQRRADGNTNEETKGTINIIALGEGATAVCNYLNSHWSLWREYIAAIAIGDGYIWDKPYMSWEPDFRAFFASRARIYLLSKAPLNTPIDDDDGSIQDAFGAPCYSSGEERWTECIMPRCYEKILEWFKIVERTPGYAQLQKGGRKETEREGKEG